MELAEIISMMSSVGAVEASLANRLGSSFSAGRKSEGDHSTRVAAAFGSDGGWPASEVLVAGL